jgi:FkbM family methyltransferase
MTKTLTPSSVKAWVPWVRGPREQFLRCVGTPLQRGLAAAHFGWPLSRGHTRFVQLLPSIDALRHVSFESDCGVRLTLDLTDLNFLYLSGKLPSEPLEVAILRALVRPGDTVIDVGAHRGLFIAHLLGRCLPGGVMHAFEPAPSNVDFIRCTFGEPQGLAIHPVAVSDRVGTARFEQAGSLVGKLSGPDVSDVDYIEVELTTLDEALLSTLPHAPIVAKVDVEGFEPEVMRGAAGLLGRSLPAAWLVESLPGRPEERKRLLEVARELLRPASIYGVTNGVGLVSVERVRDDDESTNNLLFVSEAFLPRLDSLRAVTS